MRRTRILTFSLSTLAAALAVASIGLTLGGCASHRQEQEAAVPTNTAPAAMAPAGAGAVPIEKIPFQTGVSSATVEKLARQHACTGGQGAGLITQAGPAEVYRMQCDSGKVFMARCELRQCKPM